MRRAAVLGRPVVHSLSPVLHQAAYEAMGLTDWRYEAIDCGEAELPGFIARLDVGWAGFSLTMPLKRVVLDVAVDASPLAAAVGAANTLVPRPNGWYADNTDVGGMLDALRLADVGEPGDAVVLGAGGTARSALAALRELGVHTPTVAVRDPARAGELRRAAERLGVAPSIVCGLTNPVVYSAPLVISTVPKGVADVVAQHARWMPTADAVVFDVVYDPWPTALAAAAAAAGRRVVSGFDLLLHQAVGQVRLMTGCGEVPVEAMRAALERAVHLRTP